VRCILGWASEVVSRDYDNQCEHGEEQDDQFGAAHFPWPSCAVLRGAQASGRRLHLRDEMILLTMALCGVLVVAGAVVQ
jgi:hypothetical protein